MNNALKPIIISIPDSASAADIKKAAARLEQDLRENFQRLQKLLDDYEDRHND